MLCIVFVNFVLIDMADVLFFTFDLDFHSSHSDKFKINKSRTTMHEICQTNCKMYLDMCLRKLLYETCHEILLNLIYTINYWLYILLFVINLLTNGK